MALMAFVSGAVAGVRAARHPGILRRLRSDRDDDGRRVGAAGADRDGDRLGADGAAAGAGARARSSAACSRRRSGSGARFSSRPAFYLVAFLLVVFGYRERIGRPAAHVVTERRARDVRDAARRAALPAVHGRDLRIAARRSQLRPDPAAVPASRSDSIAATRAVPERRRCSRPPPSLRRSATRRAGGCWNGARRRPLVPVDGGGGRRRRARLRAVGAAAPRAARRDRRGVRLARSVWRRRRVYTAASHAVPPKRGAWRSAISRRRISWVSR